ncbi:MAG: WcaI family glycosyltransferase [Gammaproteobacteria bacterium]|nr:WcaI family glycosyltransferase [Gammaproteobacteria bacterium]
MRFVLYSLNFSPELTGIGKYNGDLVDALAEKGIRTDVVTAPPYYPEWRRHQGFRNGWSKTQLKNGISVFRSPIYVPRALNTYKRLLHLSTFALSSFISFCRLLRSSPKVVFMVQPTLFCAPLTLLFCRLTGAKSVMHIQDFEVDAMFGLGMAKGDLIARLISIVEAKLMSQFDAVSSISFSMLENARRKGVLDERLMHFPNWADIDFITPDDSGDDIRQLWGFDAKDKVVLYSGNIGEKQGLEVVLEAAEFFVDKPNVKFLIVGAGAYKGKLEALARTKGLSNVVFKPLQPWEDVPQLLAMADIHLVVQKKGAADAVLPSKLTNILSAGGYALVTAEKNTELGRILDKYPGIYTLVAPENSPKFIEGLQLCLTKDTAQSNKVARRYAEENLSKQAIINRFVENLTALCNEN